MADRKFVVRFPVTVASSGGIATDFNRTSELVLLMGVAPNQRLDDEEFGATTDIYEQDNLQIDAKRLVTILSLQLSIQRFVPNVIVLGINLFKDSEGRRLIVDIIFSNLDVLNADPERLIVSVAAAGEAGSIPNRQQPS